MENINIKKPCVVETPQGFSVSYKERFLYSKYNPTKLIKDTITSIQAGSGSIFLCLSPALCYGLKELLNKLEENCIIYLCEFDNNLWDFCNENLHKLTETDPLLKKEINNRIFFPKIEELYNLPITIYDKCKTGKYRRIIPIDFSAGKQFNTVIYSKLTAACTNSVKTFWTNRLTLTKFGRKYSHNFFTNLKNIGETTPIENYFNSVSKPIIVIGAGQSVDSIEINKNNYSDYFIICVDTILPALISKEIIPDCVFVEEAQIVISKAFICTKYDIHLFAGLSSLPLLSKYFTSKNISYFATEYTKASFMDNLQKLGLLPAMNPPFGSVGLTAVYYSLKFRVNVSVPVYISGLDFSYSIGHTHGKGTIAHKARLISTNKLLPIENYNAAFLSEAQKFNDKSGNIFITTPSLSGYCLLFRNLFSNEKNLFDIGNCGMDLGIKKTKLQPAGKTVENNVVRQSAYSKEYNEKLQSYLKTEVKELKELRSLLTEKTSLSEKELKEKITKKAAGKEYLYLHFPDGYCFNYNQSFLNRIRTEIDFFLKIFE